MLRNSVFLVFLLLVNMGQSQEKVGQFIVYKAENGISSGFNYRVCQSSDGFLWIGTGNGLVRFDGKYYQRILAGPNSITDNLVVDVAEDARGNIWIGGFSGGVSRYNPESGTFRRYPVIGFPGNNMQQINKILTLKNGEVWLGTGKMGLALYIQETDSFRFFKPDPGPYIAGNNDQFTVRDFCPDPGNDSIFWLVSGYRILRFNRVTFMFSEIRYSYTQTLDQLFFTSVCHDGIHGLWLGTWGNGVKFLPVGIPALYSVILPDPGKRKLNRMIVHDINRLNDSTLLLACAQTGLFTYDHRNHQLRDITPIPAQAETVTEFPFYHSISVTPDAGIFIGATGFLLQMHPAYNRMSDFIEFPNHGNDSISSSAKLIDGFDGYSIYMACYGAVNLVKVSRQNHSVKELKVFHSSSVKGLRDMEVINADTMLAVGYDGKLYAMDKREEQMKPYKLNSLNTNHFVSVESDSKGFVWFMVSGKLYRWHPATYQVTDSFSLPPGRSVDLGDAGSLRFFDLQTDSGGRAWLSSNQGLWMADHRADTLIQYSPGNSSGRKLRHPLVKSFLIDSADNIWVGYNGEGLQVFNAVSFSVVHEQDPSMFPSVQINDLVQTAGGQVLAATPEGLVSIDPGNFQWQMFGKFDGLPGQSIESGLFTTKDGWIFVPFRNRYHFFREDELSVYFGNFKINITGFSINGKEQAISRLNRGYPEVELKHSRNNVSVSFAAMQWQYPWRTSYHYRFFMDRDTSEWISINEPRLHFSALSPGKYALQLGASGAGNSKGWSKQLFFHIKPPFWLENWFIFLMNVAVVGLIYILYRFRIEQLRKPAQVRDAISKNLHDDIGSSLSNVQILNELVLRNLENPDKTRSLLLRAREDLQRISESLSDIVWNINPRNDDLPTMFIRMQRYAADAFDGKDIRYTQDFPSITRSLKMKMEKKRDFYLVFKESVNNLVKYSGATYASVKVEILDNWITLDVQDDGTGFDPAVTISGNGLNNMRQRAYSSGGKITIESKKGKGTTIHLEVPLN